MAIALNDLAEAQKEQGDSIVAEATLREALRIATKK